MAKKEPKKQEKPKVHQKLKGFEISINTFGEIQNTIDIDRINAFLNNNLEDKKLKNQAPNPEEGTP